MLKNLVKAHVGQRPFSIPSPFTRLTEEFPGHTESARWKANVLTMQYHSVLFIKPILRAE